MLNFAGIEEDHHDLDSPPRQRVSGDGKDEVVDDVTGPLATRSVWHDGFSVSQSG